MAQPDQDAGEGRAVAGGGLLVQQEEVPGDRGGAQQCDAHHRQVCADDDLLVFLHTFTFSHYTHVVHTHNDCSLF